MSFYTNYIKILIKILSTLLFLSSIKAYDWISCDQHVSTVLDEGTFSHLNYPFKYASGLDCRIHIYVPEYRVKPQLCFAFKRFRLNPSQGCGHDKLMIPGLGDFCGDGWKNGVENKSTNLLQTVRCVKVDSYQTILSFTTSKFSIPNFGFFAHFYIHQYESDYNATEVAEKKCGDNEVSCADQSCILRTFLCDGIVHCADASDESTYHAGCVEKEIFQETCSFEHHSCGFKFVNGVWNRNKAVGSKDHTTETSNGYEMTRRGLLYSKAELISPLIILKKKKNLNQTQLTQHQPWSNNMGGKSVHYCFSFWYKMHNRLKKLEVLLYQNFSSSKWFPTSSDENTLLMSRLYYGNKWTLAETNLREDQINGSKIQFVSHIRNSDSFIDIISIDDIALIPGKCYRGDISCTFEAGLCGWRRLMNSWFDAWSIRTSTHKTLKYTNMNESYLFMNSSGRALGRRAVMVSAPINVMISYTACLSFKLFIKGPGSASVKVNVSDGSGRERTVWETRNRNSFDWKEIYASVSFHTRSIVMIKLIAFNRTTADVYVGIDDIVMYASDCQFINKPNSNQNIPTIAPTFIPGNRKTNPYFNSPRTTYLPMFCPVDWFRCRNGLNCLSKSSRCDGRLECYDGSDEEECAYIDLYPDRVDNNGKHIGPIIASVFPIGTILLFVLVIFLVIFFKRRRNRRLQASRRVTTTTREMDLTALESILTPPPYNSNTPQSPVYLFPPPSYEDSKFHATAPKLDELPDDVPPEYIADIHI